MKTFDVKETNERIMPASGLAIVGTILNKFHFVKRFNARPNSGKRSGKHIRLGDLLATYIAMLCMGKPGFASVHEMDDDPEAFRMCLGISRIPSEETLRQRLDETGDSMRSVLLDENVRMLKANGVHPTPIPEGFVPVDIDVTPQDNSKSHKEGVSRTYKGFDGLAPINAYIGAEGYLANTELREGKQHCQKHTPQFLMETVDLCKKMTQERLLVRMDSGNDSSDNIGIFLNTGCYFIIKRNLRQENREEWLERLRDGCRDVTHPRDGKDVYIGTTWKEVSFTDAAGQDRSQNIRIVYEITERSIDKRGQYLFPHDIEVDMYWDNTGLPDRDVIRLYHQHGESEQYHSEFKTDMDIERLPSGKFATNCLVMELAVIAYNILRMIGQESIGLDDAPGRKKVKRRRLRTVITNIILFACHLTGHAGRFILGMGRSNTWRYTFRRLYYSFSQY